MLMHIDTKSIVLAVLVTILSLLLIVGQKSLAHQLPSGSSEELAKLDEGRLVNFLSIAKQAAVQALSYFKDVAMNMPFGKILLAGALISLFSFFLRLIIVLGPIIALGAMTREGTDPRDFLMMFVNFYNNIVQNMDTQATPSYSQPM